MLKTCARDHLIDVRDEALLRTLWDTGGRLAEVTGLKVADVDFGGQVVRLFGKGRRERLVCHRCVDRFGYPPLPTASGQDLAAGPPRGCGRVRRDR